jgi:hypothetical protein
MMKKPFRTIALAVVLSIFALSACAKEEPEAETYTFFEGEDIIDDASATATPEPSETLVGDEAGDETTDESALNDEADNDIDTANNNDSNVGITQNPQAIVGEWVIPYVMDKGKQSTIEEFAETWNFGENDAGEVLDLAGFVYELFSNFVLTVREDGTGEVATVTEGELVTLPLVYTYNGNTLHMTHEDGEEINVLYFALAVFEYDEEAGLLINHYWLSSDENTYLILEKR